MSKLDQQNSSTCNRLTDNTSNNALTQLRNGGNDFPDNQLTTDFAVLCKPICLVERTVSPLPLVLV